MSMSRAMDATQWLLVLHKCILRSILKSDSPCADQLTWLPCWCWRAVVPGFWSHGPIVCRSNHTLNRLLEVMADRLGEEHGGVTVTVHEGVPPTRLTRQQVPCLPQSSSSCVKLLRACVHHQRPALAGSHLRCPQNALHVARLDECLTRV